MALLASRFCFSSKNFNSLFEMFGLERIINFSVSKFDFAYVFLETSTDPTTGFDVTLEVPLSRYKIGFSFITTGFICGLSILAPVLL